MTYAVLGPPGTFSEEAVMIYGGSPAQILAAESIPDLFRLVEKGLVSDGLVPLENSATGLIATTLECLALSDLKIRGSIEMPIKQCLLANGSYQPCEIELLISQQVAMAQCRNYIRNNLKGVRTEITESTAQAARLARDESRRAAAIGSKRLARLYNLKIIACNIQEEINYTRFIHIGAGRTEEDGRCNSSLILSLPDKAGALYNLLGVFARLNLNLQKIESHPARDRGNYLFYIEIEPGRTAMEMEFLLEELRTHCNWVKNLGSYDKRRITGC